MQTQITVSITQDHINRGLRGHCGRCPVALAIKDAVRGQAKRFRGKVEVFNSRANIRSYDGERTALAGRWVMPLDVGDFIYDFDIGGRGPRVRPFTFTLDLDFPFWAERPAEDAPEAP